MTNFVKIQIHTFSGKVYGDCEYFCKNTTVLDFAKFIVKKFPEIKYSSVNIKTKQIFSAATLGGAYAQFDKNLFTYIDYNNEICVIDLYDCGGHNGPNYSHAISNKIKDYEDNHKH